MKKMALTIRVLILITTILGFQSEESTFNGYMTDWDSKLGMKFSVYISSWD